MTETELDLDALKRRLEQLEATEDQRQRQREAELAYLPGAPPEPPRDSFTGQLLAAQNRAREARRAADEEAAREYEAQLQRSAPEREQLRARLAELDEKTRAETERYDRTIARFSTEQAKLRRRLGELETPPAARVPEPQVKGEPGQVIWAYGHQMVVPADALRHQQAQRNRHERNGKPGGRKR